MLGLCQQFLDEGKAVRIAGPDAPMWLQVSADDIEGEFSIETEGGSTQAINPITKARQGMDILTQIAPMLAQLGYNPENAIRSALTYLGLNPDHLLVRPEPQPAPAPAGVPPMGPEMMGGLPPEMAGMPPAGGMPMDMNDPALLAMLAGGMPPSPEGGMLL